MSVYDAALVFLLPHILMPASHCLHHLNWLSRSVAYSRD